MTSENTATAAEEEKDTQRHYIIAVHGIGDQRINTTATDVAQQFARNRIQKGKKSPDADYYKCLLPAYLSAQSVRRGKHGFGWSEFSGIPLDPNASIDLDRPILGTPAAQDAGKNFRFAEFYWADILRGHQERYASPVEDWALAVQARLNSSHMKNIPAWVKPSVNNVIDFLLPLNRFLGFKFSAIRKTIFDDFLGDVHLYADYDRTRGKMARRFHMMLDELMVRDFLEWRIRQYNIDKAELGEEAAKTKTCTYTPPVFTIIAHSLGSIASFDALTYAHTSSRVRSSDYPHQDWPSSLPFLGYSYRNPTWEKTWERIHSKILKLYGTDLGSKDKGECSLANLIKHTDFNLSSFPENQALYEFIQGLSPQDNTDASNNDCIKDKIQRPPLLWRGRVKNLITFGSPIDKYLMVWPHKYEHMSDASWVETAEGINPINHFNFCDEWDPVGHYLNFASSHESYEKIFRMDQKWDQVFKRYTIPGQAHNDYFTDDELFDIWINEIIDKTEEPGNTECKDKQSAIKSHEKWPKVYIPAILGVTSSLLFLVSLFNLGPKLFFIPSIVCLVALFWVIICRKDAFKLQKLSPETERAEEQPQNTPEQKTETTGIRIFLSSMIVSVLIFIGFNSYLYPVGTVMTVYDELRIWFIIFTLAYAVIFILKRSVELLVLASMLAMVTGFGMDSSLGSF